MYVSQQTIHKLAIEKGWWQDQQPSARIPEALMLIVSEAAEAMEEWRDLDLQSPTYYRLEGQKPLGLAIEVADIVIRCRDLAQALGFDLEQAIAQKHAYNQTRPLRHGHSR